MYILHGMAIHLIIVLNILNGMQLHPHGAAFNRSQMAHLTNTAPQLVLTNVDISILLGMATHHLTKSIYLKIKVQDFQPQKLLQTIQSSRVLNTIQIAWATHRTVIQIEE